MRALTQLVPLDEQPGMPEAIAAVITGSQGTVCQVCGHERMGHTVESQWNGFAPHPYTPAPADAAMIERARNLTTAAYRAHRLTIPERTTA